MVWKRNRILFNVGVKCTKINKKKKRYIWVLLYVSREYLGAWMNSHLGNYIISFVIRVNVVTVPCFSQFELYFQIKSINDGGGTENSSTCTPSLTIYTFVIWLLPIFSSATFRDVICWKIVFAVLDVYYELMNDPWWNFNEVGIFRKSLISKEVRPMAHNLAPNKKCLE